MHKPDEPAGAHESWEQIVARFARFAGVVGEITDPLTWGLDLEEETVTGSGSEHRDPTEERFLRAYVSFVGEAVDVETLRVGTDDAQHVEDIVRAALSGALAAPLHSDVPDGTEGPTGADFADAYQDYRSAMRAIVEEVDLAPLQHTAFVVDDVSHPCVRVAVRATVAVYVPLADRAVIVSGPADLVDRVDISTAPIQGLLHGDGETRF
ncbi:hypothetical protein H9623_00490 [Oerskovia sp. Sa1BUA8]|uniref:Uncharacterized protein n=1 Tax=Oerskovia douganii TaxID=2762210 RepID=A0A9D5YWR5_9CELL|nr:hypothetical protein [Oerskovia douganii]MBE7698783.1 hypothetical protein [Oerskovia douganii]